MIRHSTTKGVTGESSLVHGHTRKHPKHPLGLGGRSHSNVGAIARRARTMTRASKRKATVPKPTTKANGAMLRCARVWGGVERESVEGDDGHA